MLTSSITDDTFIFQSHLVPKTGTAYVIHLLVDNSVGRLLAKNQYSSSSMNMDARNSKCLNHCSHKTCKQKYIGIIFVKKMKSMAKVSKT